MLVHLQNFTSPASPMVHIIQSSNRKLNVIFVRAPDLFCVLRYNLTESFMFCACVAPKLDIRFYKNTRRMPRQIFTLELRYFFPCADDGRTPDFREVWENFERQQVSCRMTTGSVCAKWTSYYENAGTSLFNFTKLNSLR